jgi:hypothetical protein
MQNQIRKSSALLSDSGGLLQVGWSPQPLLDSNLEKANFYALKIFQPLRMKRWDYYGISTPTHFFSFTVSDIGYLGMVFAYVVDFEKKTHHEETVAVPFAGGVQIPRNSTQGQTCYRNKKVSLVFEKDANQRFVKVRWENFENGQSLNAELSMQERPEYESMNLVIPIEEKRFYFNRKINCLPVSGWIEYLGRRHELSPQTCLANLDWGRGVWAYKSFWVWASASGFLPNGRPIGLNMGYGFGDSSKATENAFILDNKIQKLENIHFEYDSRNFMAPWKMRSDDGRLELTFTPFYERIAKTDAKILTSEVHQMFGKYAGTLVSDQGEKLAIQDLIGFAEEHHACW